MKFVNGISELSDQHRPCVATIGNFDGVHLGHQKVVSTLLQAAKTKRLPSTLITFEPLAREYFAPESVLRLGSLAQRCDELAALGVDQVLAIEFNSSLVELSPQQFVKKVLVEGLGVKYLSVGDDFKFGKNRTGNFEYLQQAGVEFGFDVVNHSTFKLDDTRVSSGRVRDAVSNGDFDQARRLLGRAYCVSGTIALGQQLGRTIGFPTANIVLDRENYAVHGVYAVLVHLQDERVFQAVANVGNRPTVDGKENRLEVHIFDFDDDLYGQKINVEFISKIREEKKFDSFDLLKKQIEADANEARLYFKQST